MKRRILVLALLLLGVSICISACVIKSNNLDYSNANNLISDNEIVGFWHASPFVAAGFQDRYLLYSNNSFLYYYSDDDTENRVKYISGTWEIKDNMLCLEIDQKRLIEGGEFVKEESPSSVLGYTYMIVSGEEVTVELNTPLEINYPLRNYMVNDEEGGSSLVIGGLKYWQLSEDPDVYTE